jgi:hypothetical protein
MHSSLQLDSIKLLLREQYGVPDGVCDRLDNINRLTYREAQEDERRRVAQLKEDNGEDDE